MAFTYKYAPFLRTKTGEIDALRNLVPAVRARLFPVMHVTEKPPETFAASITDVCKGSAVALDGQFNVSATGSTKDFYKLFDAMGKGGVSVVPVVSCGASSQNVSAVMSLVNRYASGLVVKSTLVDLKNVNSWIANHERKHQEVDLVIDAGYVSGYDPELFEMVVVETINKHLLPLAPWRSMTLCSSAARKDLTGLPTGRTNVPRRDWQLWQAVAPKVPFALHYGDYGISHPDMTEPPGAAMASATVSVRYTTDAQWIVLKGRPQGGLKGQPLRVQYPAHAKVLSADPLFDGLPATCWGDQRIGQIASGATGPGSRTTWVGISANRHLSLVAHRLP